MPIANGFLTAAQFETELFFDLTAGFCHQCAMVQLIDSPPRELLFNQDYAFFSSTSSRMADHFERLARLVMADYLQSSDPLVVEIGCNDGIMLRHFAKAGIRHLGIEPSGNVARIAADQGVSVLSQYFDKALAADIVADQGQAEAILGANVMCHIPYIHSVLEGITSLLKPGGVLMFEDPYLGHIVEKTSYDQIYDEHALYFSVTSVSNLLVPHGLELVDVQPIDVHGGSMRYVVAHKGAKSVSAAVAATRKNEQAKGLDRLQTFVDFRHRVERSRDSLMTVLSDIKRQGKRVVGYGATSKSTSVANYCGITPADLEFIADSTPMKQGKFSPGAHIPIRPSAAFATPYPDYALLFAWNHADEIMAKEQQFLRGGGSWIVYVPDVRVMTA